MALVGCGGISLSHLAAYAKMPDVEIVAAVDVSADRLRLMRDKFGVPAECLFGADIKTGRTTSKTAWREMLRKVKPDAVDVCTPNYLHCQPVVDACRAGCHAMVEKPMAMNSAECRRMVAAADKAGVRLSVGFQHRYRDTSLSLSKARREGAFGDIMFVKVHAMRRRGIPNWGVFGRRELQGGGPMIDIGVHMLEAAYDFMGSPRPVAASANVWTYLGDKPCGVKCEWPGWDYKTYTVEDLAAGQIRFDNGAILQIESSFAAHVRDYEQHDWEALGTKAGCRWSTAEVYADAKGRMVNSTPKEIGANDWDTIFYRKLRNWADACLYGGELCASGRDGLAIQKMLDAIYESARKGREVRIR